MCVFFLSFHYQFPCHVLVRNKRWKISKLKASIVTKNKYFWLFDLLINKRVQRRRMQILLINFYANTKWQPKYTQILLFPNYDVYIYSICACQPIVAFSEFVPKKPNWLYTLPVCPCVLIFRAKCYFFPSLRWRINFFFQYMIYRMLYAQHLFSRSNGDMPLKNEIKLVVSLFSVKIMMKNRMQWKIGPDLMMMKKNHTKLISSSYKWNCAEKKWRRP